MNTKTIKMQRGHHITTYRWWKAKGLKGVILCQDGLDDYFEIPDDAQTLWVRLSKGRARPTEDSLKIKRVDIHWFWLKAEESEFEEADIPVDITRTFAKVLADVGTPCWMQVWYSNE